MRIGGGILIGLLTWGFAVSQLHGADPFAFPEQRQRETSTVQQVAADEPKLAPVQRPQPTYFPAGHSLYQQADIDEVLDFSPLESHRMRQQSASTADYEADLLAPDPAPIEPVQYPFEASAGEDLPAESPLAIPSQPITPHVEWSKQLLQVTELPGSGDQLGILELDARATFHSTAAPFLRFTPRFAMRSLSGPESTDLPGSLYDISLAASIYLPVSEQLRLFAEISPGTYSDFQAYNSDSLRLPARAFAFYRLSPAWDLAAGFVYFDRDTLGFLPAAGLTYTPNDAWKLEITFPKPKLSWRYYDDGDHQRTMYVAGEFGGGSWTVRRAASFDDSVTLSDLRLLLGWEHREGNLLHWSLEAGWVFNRTIEYRSHLGDRDLNSTAMLRFAIGY